MNKTHGSRKQDIEMHIKIAILSNDIKKSIELCEKYSVSSKRYGDLVKQVSATGE